MASVKNLPETCVRVPFIQKAAEVCLQFYNLNTEKTSFGGCARISVKLLGVTLLKIDLGCLKINVPQRINESQSPVEVPAPAYLGDEETKKILAAFYKKNE